MAIATHFQETVGRKCVQHLRNESQVLERFLETAELLNQALTEGQQEMLFRFKNSQQQVLSEAQRLRDARGELQQAMADCFPDTPRVTISEFAKALDPDLQQQVDEGRRQVLALTREVERISQTNETLAARS